MSEPTNQLFQSLWVGPISPYEAMCMRSFIDHGHAFDLYTYSLDLEVPHGVRLKDASEILAEGEYFTYKSGSGKGSHSAFSNLFRYKLLYERGGWWVDTDVICLKPNIGPFDKFFAHENPEIVNGAVLYFKQGDPFLLACLEETLNLRGRAKWGEIGPRLITRLLKQHGRLECAHPEVSCYPIHYKETIDLLRPCLADALLQRIQSSIFVHLWNEVLRRRNIKKTLLPPQGSLLRQFAEHHRVDGWLGEYDRDFFEHLAVAKAHHDLSVTLAEQGHQDEALAAARRAVECDPENAGLHDHLGNLLQKGERLDEAEAAHRRAIELEPDHARAHRQLSVIFTKQGRQDEALAAARRAVECDPEDAGLHYHLGNLVQKGGRLDEAEAAHRRAIELAARPCQGLSAAERDFY